MGVASSFAGCCKQPNFDPQSAAPPRWQNWSETVVHDNLRKIFRPTTLRELKANVSEAANNGWQLRAVGSGHSWSNLGLPPRGGAILITDQLSEVLGVDGNVVEVEGGITIKNLNEKLWDLGLSMPNLGDANPQTIAGATGTETHGSGARLPSISELIESMTIVTADGQDRVLEGDELMAGRVSLGKLGVVYSMKLKVEPRYFLKHKEEMVEFLEEEPGIDELLNKHRHLEYWYYPYTDMAARIIRDKTHETIIDNAVSGVDRFFVGGSSSVAERNARLDPEDLPGLMAFAVDITPDVERQGRSYDILLGKSNIWREHVKTFTMEYQFPYENLWPAFKALKDSIDVARTKGVYVGTPIQFRFTKKSERSFLSHFRFSPTASFSISFFRRGHGAHVWLPDIERRLIALDGKPHRGKMYYEPPGIDDRFEEVQRRLDPDEMFAFEQPAYQPAPNAFTTT